MRTCPHPNKSPSLARSIPLIFLEIHLLQLITVTNQLLYWKVASWSPSPRHRTLHFIFHTTARVILLKHQPHHVWLSELPINLRMRPEHQILCF